MNTRTDIVNKIDKLQVCRCDADSRHVVFAEGTANRCAANARLCVSDEPSPAGVLLLELVADHDAADVITEVSAARAFDLGGFQAVTVLGVENRISEPVPNARPDAVEAPRWRATHFLLNKRAPEPVLPGTLLTATLSGTVSGTIHGSGGCNTYGASFVAEPGDPDGINIHDLGHTLKICDTPEGILAQERRFFAALLQAKRIERGDEALVLRGDASGVGAGVRFVLDEPK